MKRVKFSLILPCYNEHEHIRGSVKRILNVLKKLHFPWEVIFIDDKSTDNTLILLKQIIKKYPKNNIKLIRHTSNQGRGATVSEGLKKARGEVSGYIDIDCEVSPFYIPEFIHELETSKADIIVANRLYKVEPHNAFRFLASKVYAFIIRLVFNLPIRDSEAGYKFFKTSKIKPVLTKTKDTHWFWDTEIIIRSIIAGLTVYERKVIFKRRNDKTSTVKIFSDTIRYIKSIIVLKRQLIYGSI